MSEIHDGNKSSKGVLSAQIEALLFYNFEPLRVDRLAQILETSDSQVQEALEDLAGVLQGRGLTLVREGGECALRTASAHSDLIEHLKKKDREGPIGKAGLETLSIILYQAPVTRAKIDHIRGVNSQFILRRLLIRGLINKEKDEQKRGSNLYSPTIGLLSHLGISDLNELPEYDKVGELLQQNDDEGVTVHEGGASTE